MCVALPIELSRRRSIVYARTTVRAVASDVRKIRTLRLWTRRGASSADHVRVRNSAALTSEADIPTGQAVVLFHKRTTDEEQIEGEIKRDRASVSTDKEVRKEGTKPHPIRVPVPVLLSNWKRAMPSHDSATHT